MVSTHHTCGRCASPRIRKNGSSSGRAKYQCTACHHQGYFQPAAIARAVRYAQVEKLLVERVAQRAIVRLTGVSRMTVAKLAKKSATQAEHLVATGPPTGAGTR